VYVYDFEECGEHGNNADGDGNGSIKSDNNDTKHDAEPESFADANCEPESGVEPRTESEPEWKPDTDAESDAG